MEERTDITVPYIVYEGAQARQERTVNRLFIVVIILIVALVASNVFWLITWNSYEYVSDQVELDADGGNANYIGRDLSGVLNNGEDSR